MKYGANYEVMIASRQLEARVRAASYEPFIELGSRDTNGRPFVYPCYLANRERNLMHWNGPEADRGDYDAEYDMLIGELLLSYVIAIAGMLALLALGVAGAIAIVRKAAGRE